MKTTATKAKTKIIAAAMALTLVTTGVGTTLMMTPAFSITADAAISTGSVLKKGSRGQQVKYLQMNLNALGYGAGSVDGVFGNGTKNAVIRFQKANGLSADGMAGPKTIQKMNSIATNLQANLNKLGYNCGSTDGLLGPNTTRAIRNFQSANKLSIDGMAGPKTLSKIQEKLKSVQTTSTPTSTTTKSGYNVSAALNYAKANVYQRSDWLCAEYVSNCLRAGGLNLSVYKSCSQMNTALERMNGVSKTQLKVVNGKVTRNNNPNIAVGDIIMAYCNRCADTAHGGDGLPYVHVVMVSGFASNGEILVYAHNRAKNNESIYLSYCNKHGYISDRAYLYHFN